MRQEKPSQCVREGNFCEARNDYSGITMQFQCEYGKLEMILMRTDAKPGKNGAAPVSVLSVAPHTGDQIFDQFKKDAESAPKVSSQETA